MASFYVNKWFGKHVFASAEGYAHPCTFDLLPFVRLRVDVEDQIRYEEIAPQHYNIIKSGTLTIATFAFAFLWFSSYFSLYVYSTPQELEVYDEPSQG